VTEKTAYSEDPTSFSALLKRESETKGSGWAEKVVALPPRTGDAAAAPDEQYSPVSPHELSSAVELIEEASEAIRISRQRVEELEAQLEQFAVESSEEMRRLNDEIDAGERRFEQSEQRVRQAESRAGQAEARAAAAESRASQAEAWLVRLHDAVQAGFAPLQRRQADRQANG
jgi:hypothetical protein